MYIFNVIVYVWYRCVRPLPCQCFMVDLYFILRLYERRWGELKPNIGV